MTPTLIRSHTDQPTIDELKKAECACSDGPFHYQSCPMYSDGCNEAFAKLGTNMGRLRDAPDYVREENAR